MKKINVQMGVILGLVVAQIASIVVISGMKSDISVLKTGVLYLNEQNACLSEITDTLIEVDEITFQALQEVVKFLQ